MKGVLKQRLEIWPCHRQGACICSRGACVGHDCGGKNYPLVSEVRRCPPRERGLHLARETSTGTPAHARGPSTPDARLWPLIWSKGGLNHI